MNLGNVMIFGDSYSTFRGWVPEGFGYSYSEDGTDGNEVIDVRDTWWHRLITRTNSKLIMNNSWSGSTIGYTGYNGEDLSKTKSFIYRFNKLYDEGFFEENEINTLFIFGGTNDSWSNAPIGNLMFSDFKRDDLYSVLPAVCCLFELVSKKLPKTRIVCLVNCDLKEEITNGLINAAEHYSIESVKFEKIDKFKGHPTIKGMKQIEEQIATALNL